MLKKEVSNLFSTTFKLPEHTRQLIKSLSESYGSQGTVIAGIGGRHPRHHEG